MENPFQFGQIVGGKNFCPRPSLEKQLRAAFRAGRNTVLLGERGTGKSSLIRHSAEKTRGRRLFHVDLGGVKSIEDIVTRAARALARFEKTEPARKRFQKLFPNLRSTARNNPITGLPDFNLVLPHGEMIAEDLNLLADLWADLQKEGKIIVALDEFQDLLTLPAADAALVVLEKRMRKPGPVAFCLAGRLNHGGLDASLSPVARGFPKAALLEVKRDDFDGWEKFLAGKFRASRRKIHADVLDLMVAFAGNNPGDTLQLCRAVWNISPPGREIDAGAVLAGLQEVFRNERKGYALTLGEVSSQQLAVLRALARLGGVSIQSKAFLRETGITHASSVKAAMVRLLDRRLVHHDGAAYRFSNPFFKAWLLREGI